MGEPFDLDPFDLLLTCDGSKGVISPLDQL